MTIDHVLLWTLRARPYPCVPDEADAVREARDEVDAAYRGDLGKMSALGRQLLEWEQTDRERWRDYERSGKQWPELATVSGEIVEPAMVDASRRRHPVAAAMLEDVRGAARAGGRSVTP